MISLEFGQNLVLRGFQHFLSLMMVYKHTTASLKPWRAIVSHVDTSETPETLIFSIFSIARIMMCTTLHNYKVHKRAGLLIHGTGSCDTIEHCDYREAFQVYFLGFFPPPPPPWPPEQGWKILKDSSMGQSPALASKSFSI